MSRLSRHSALRTAIRPPQLWCPTTQHVARFVRPATGSLQARHHSSSSSFSSTPPSSSVTPSEVTHFTALASSWWDPYGPSRLLHLMNPLRHDFIRQCTQTSQTQTRPIWAETADESGRTSQENTTHAYLDIGCGGGIFASSAARLQNTVSVTAIDPTPEVIAVAKRHQRSDPLLSKQGRLTYLNCAIEDLQAHIGELKLKQNHSDSRTKAANEDVQYDFVTIFEVIEHVSQPSTFIRQALKHLKPGGWLIGSTIARHPVSYLTTKVIAEAPWPIGVVPSGTHDWDKYINPVELVQWFQKENRDGKVEGQEPFGPVQVQGCIYLPLVGWKFVNGSQDYGNYFFGVQKLR